MQTPNPAYVIYLTLNFTLSICHIEASVMMNYINARDNCTTL